MSQSIVNYGDPHTKAQALNRISNFLIMYWCESMPDIIDIDVKFIKSSNDMIWYIWLVTVYLCVYAIL